MYQIFNKISLQRIKLLKILKVKTDSTDYYDLFYDIKTYQNLLSREFMVCYVFLDMFVGHFQHLYKISTTRVKKKYFSYISSVLSSREKNKIWNAFAVTTEEKKKHESDFELLCFSAAKS